MISIYLPKWFLKKNNLMRNPNCLDGNIIRETSKAIYFKLNSIIALYHNHNGKIWIPKSLIIKTKKCE